jgi:hypothetical protein
MHKALNSCRQARHADRWPSSTAAPNVLEEGCDKLAWEYDMIDVRLAAYTAGVFVTLTQLGLGQVTTAPAGSPPAEGTVVDSAASSQLTPTEKEAFARLEKLGYTSIQNVKSGPEGISAKAMKDGREVSLVVDSGGHVRER